MAREPQLTMAIITRADLKLSKGKLAAQAAHAAVDAALTSSKVATKQLADWRNNGARKIVVVARNLEHLKRIYGEARVDGLVAEMITDAGHTEIPAGTVTVVAIGPAERDEVDAIIGSLPLLS
ncbi:MAG: peptidyl-tRNA hydrolase Pth2 [Pseudomonadales bacterium]|nr:peptidyl-tRNA hydrolase Pth2 [Pseudomonadales bacterium]